MRTVSVIGLGVGEEDSGGYSFFVCEMTVVSERSEVMALQRWEAIRLI